MVKHEIVEQSEEGTINYKLIRSERGKRRMEFNLGRVSNGSCIRYFIKPDYSNSAHRFEAISRLVDGYHVLFCSKGAEKDIFGVEPNQVEAEKKLRQKMGEVLESRLREANGSLPSR